MSDHSAIDRLHNVSVGRSDVNDKYDDSSRALTIAEITSESALDALRPEWNALVDRLTWPSPFQSWEWNRLWWKHFGAKDKLQILAFRRDGELLGIAQFYRRSHAIARVGFTSLVPIGGGQGHKFGLTEQWELLFPTLHSRDLLWALGRWLQRNRWSAVTLPGLWDNPELPPWLATLTASAAQPVILHYLDLPDTWEKFLGKLSMNARHNIRRYPERLAEDGHAFTFEVASSPQDVLACLPTFFGLHRARSQADMHVKHPDRFRIASRRAFLLEVGATLAAREQFKVGLLRIHDQIVTAQIWLEHDGAIFIYYSGFDPRWSRYAVGLVTTSEIFKEGIQRGVRRVDFLRGEGYYKDRWRANRYTRRNVVLARHPDLVRTLLALRSRQRTVVHRIQDALPARLSSRPSLLRGGSREAADS
jgi:CelD/BcsL family acetyltransferase involved in cellulose biosynthesis